MGSDLQELYRRACERYGYNQSQVQLRLYVGKFAAPVKGTHEEAIRSWCANQIEDGTVSIARARATTTFPPSSC